MRSALSLTLVLIAAMSGHSASACDPSSHPLRLLASPAFAQCFEAPGSVDFTFSAELPAVSAAELRSVVPADFDVALTSVPASRSYESATVAAVPSRGP
jgi:hypothetical protein